MSMKKTLTALFMGAAALSAQAQNSKDSTKLEEVVVTATRSSLKPSQTGKIVTVINRQTIENNQGRSLTELLNTQTGLFINGANNPLGSNVDVYFRGASRENLLIVIDGIAVFDPSDINSVFDLNNLALDQIERIEILRGGQSTLWGSNAVAGVIQIFLKKPSKARNDITVNAAYGSYNTLRWGAGIDATMNKFSYSLQLSQTRSKGFSAAYDTSGNKNFDRDPFRQLNINTDLNYRFNQHIKAKLFASSGTYHTDLDAGAYTDDRDYTSTNKNHLAGLALQYDKQKLTLSLTAAYQLTDRNFTNDSTHISSPYFSYAYGSYKSNSLNVEAFGNIRFNQHLQLVSGLQYLNQNTDQYYLSIDPSSPAPWNKYETALGKDSAKARQISAYASLLLLDISGLNMEAGMRLNRHSIYGTNATYSFNPSYNIDANNKLFVNISSAYKVPSLYQLYSEYGNKNLQPEKSVTYEIGFQTQTSDKRINMRFAAFRRTIKNLIVFYTNAAFESYYINRDDQHDHGFELESNIALAKWGKLNTNLTYVDGYGTVNNTKVNNLYRRPKLLLNSSVEINAGRGITVIPSVRYAGSRTKAPFDGGETTMPDYYTADVYVAWTFAKQSRLFVDLRNITAQQYFDIPGYATRRFNWMAGFSVRF